MSDDQRALPASAGGRLPELLVVALAVLTLVVWAAALLQSRPPPPPSLVAQGEPLVPPGGPLAVRVSAARPNATARSHVEGVLTSGDEQVRLDDGAARLSRLSGPVMADLVVDGELRVRASLGAKAGRLRLGPPKLLYSPWRAEVQTAVAATPDVGPRLPLYPVDGRVSARLPSRVLLLADAGPRVLDVEPRVQGALLPDGRVLAVDRSGLRLRVPLEVKPHGELQVLVETAEARAVGLDLLVDGAVQDVAQLLAPGGGAAVAVRLRVGPARPGDVVVVHAGGAWPDELGPWAIARIADPSTPLADWVRAVSTTAGAPPEDPLLAWLAAHPTGVDPTIPDSGAPAPGAAVAADDVLRAALGRLRPAKLRAPRLEVVPVAASPLGETLRLAYGGLGVALVLAVLGVGFLRLPGRRLAVLLSGLVVAALLAGLGATLLVVSGGEAGAAAPAATRRRPTGGA